MEIQDQIKQLQTRQRNLTVKREQLLRDAGVEERKLEESYEKLRELGIDSPEALSVTELEAFSKDLETKLEESLILLDVELKKGETLLAEYEGTEN